MLLLDQTPGEQVIVIPDWAFATLAKKGQVEDLFNFAKMRQWFSQEQLVALDVFSDSALTMFWTNGQFDRHPGNPLTRYTRSLGYIWYFPEDQGVSQNGNDADRYAKNAVSTLTDNKEYSLKLVHEHILEGLKQPPLNTKDANQSYRVYSPSTRAILIVLNQGCLTPAVLGRKEEVRLAILRDVMKQLYQYYDLNVAHKTKWFEWYLAELDCLK